MISTLWPSAPISWPPVCAGCLRPTNEMQALFVTKRLRVPGLLGSLSVDESTGAYIPMCSACKKQHWKAVKFEAVPLWLKDGDRQKLVWQQKFYFYNESFEALVLHARTTPPPSAAEQANEERRKAQERVREREERGERERIMKLRRLTGKCIMCGKPLAWIVRLLGTEKHRACVHFS